GIRSRRERSCCSYSPAPSGTWTALIIRSMSIGIWRTASTAPVISSVVVAAARSLTAALRARSRGSSGSRWLVMVVVFMFGGAMSLDCHGGQQGVVQVCLLPRGNVVELRGAWCDPDPRPRWQRLGDIPSMVPVVSEFIAVLDESKQPVRVAAAGRPSGRGDH